jgi:2-amino-4-hydroxy-6-hydroxymethyldihydropteridine diphosphokinase
VPAGVYVGLGANLGDPARQVRDAIAALDALPDVRVLRASSSYRTPPWGRSDQPDFVNAVVELDTALAPGALVDALLRVERGAGRERRGERWAPRTIDLDLLVYADRVVDAPHCRVPHPLLAERAFVLVPLAELAPELVVPGRGTVRELLDALPRAERDAVVPLPESPRG